MSDTFTVVERLPMSENCSPMKEDHFHMGFKAGENLMILHHSHPQETARYVILVHIPTGHRIQVNLPESDSDRGMDAVLCERILNDREQK